MRILLVADIHANWPALQAIDEPHDVCVCLGDLVDYGVEPAPCIDWVRRHAQYTVRGNHDHGVAQDVAVVGRNGYKYLTGATRPVSRARLGPDDVRFLARLPVTQAVTLDDVRFLFVHATPRDPLDEWAPNDAEFWARRLQHVEADVICVGHTHQPYVLEVDGKLVVNPGSVGQPRHGDPRAAYAVLDNFNVELRRVEYPVEETVRAVEESPLPDAVKAQLAAVLRTGTLENGRRKPDDGKA
ncbi:MAG TPA: metallophosphoesterase family protein [Gemmataceae bacterium]|nr:metallophosphoesterase family protein [Gemmataceae bacterium]